MKEILMNKKEIGDELIYNIKNFSDTTLHNIIMNCQDEKIPFKVFRKVNKENETEGFIVRHTITNELIGET